MKTLFAFIFVLFVSSSVFAQQYFIYGKITDKSSGEPLSYANLRVNNSTLGTAANKIGEYELRLKAGNYKLIASFIGYYSDTINVSVNRNISGLNFHLKKTSINLPEVVVKPGVNPAIAIIKKAIKVKNERFQKLNSYQFDAYTKGIIKTKDDISSRGNSVGLDIGGVDTTKLKITGILENESEGFYEKPDNYKEIIVARKQSSNFSSSINTLTGGRISQDFYNNTINFLGKNLPGPLADNALEYYYYYLQKTLAINNNKVYEILMMPANSSDPGFIGHIYITDSTYNLIKINLDLNRAANIGGLFDTVNVFQQFSQIKNSVYMPIDYRLFIKANILGLARIGFEINTILYDYKINPNLSDNIFNKAILTVLPTADKKDSTYWNNVLKIPNTREEKAAYKRIDSVSNVPRTFWDDFSPLSTRLDLSDKFSVSAPLGMYHFNRVEGSAIDFGMFLDDAMNKRLNSSLQLSYGFADKKLKKDFSISYLFGDYRTYKLSLNAYDRLQVLFGKSDNYNELTSTVLALFTKYDFRDYLYSKGFDFKASGEVFPVLRLSAGFYNRTDYNAYKNTDFSIFKRNQKFRINPSIYETKINAFTASFKLDFRNYIEDGFFRRRTSQGKSYVIFKGNLEYSSKDLLKSNLDFTKYELEANGVINTFKSANLDFKVLGIYNIGELPYQYLYSLPGNIDLTAKQFSFRTLNLNEILGSRILTINLEHNFKDELFRMLRIPGLKDWEIQLNTFVNIAYSDIGNKTKMISPYPIKTFKHPFYEVGFGLGHVLLPFELDFAWRLNYRGENNFRIGINTFAF